jgi:drug/metabolite transporter (DMT)-like permease
LVLFAASLLCALLNLLTRRLAQVEPTSRILAYDTLVLLCAIPVFALLGIAESLLIGPVLFALFSGWGIGYLVLMLSWSGKGSAETSELIALFVGTPTVWIAAWWLFAEACKRTSLRVLVPFQFLAATASMMIALNLLGRPIEVSMMAGFACMVAGCALVLWFVRRGAISATAADPEPLRADTP